MPELPEVETIRRGLAPVVVGRKIVRVEVRLKKQVRGMGVPSFVKALQGRRIESLGRRAKFLLFGLDKGLTLLGHLGMSGQISYWDHKKTDTSSFQVSPLTGLQRSPGQHPVDKHTHVLLHLDGGDRIQYRDIRQFGYLKLLPTEKVAQLPSLKRLGIEPLDGFTWPRFSEALGRHRGMLKALLLNQAAVVGLGNIYADEACFRSGLHPRQRVERLKEPQRRALFEAIPAVLNQALANKGTTLMDYRTSDGGYGLNQESLQAYGRSGEPCLKCGTELSKIQVSQRTTVFCRHCQKLR